MRKIEIFVPSAMSMFRHKQAFGASPCVLCVLHVLIPLSPPCGECERCYLSSTHTHCRTSFTDNTCTGGHAFFTVFLSPSEYVVFCGYSTWGQLNFDMRRVHTCYLSIIHLVGKWLVGHVYCMDYISSEKEQTLNLCGIYRCEADGWKNVVLGLKVSADLSV